MDLSMFVATLQVPAIFSFASANGPIAIVPDFLKAITCFSF
jgi:hypothetical protein